MIDPHCAGRLGFAYRLPTQEALPPGRNALGLFEERDAMLFVPPGIERRSPVPLMVLFHGGGGSAQTILPMLEQHAWAQGFLLLAPQSFFPTWDLVIAGNGPDRRRLDFALAEVSSRFLLDPAHLAFAGHSDGGSYALVPRAHQRAYRDPCDRLFSRVHVRAHAGGRTTYFHLARDPRRTGPSRAQRPHPFRPPGSGWL